MEQFDRGNMEPVKGNPSIIALEAWQFISPRARNCLALRDVDDEPASTVARVPIEDMRLSDLAQRRFIEVMRIPNLGRSCMCEIVMAMERYGWWFDDGTGLGVKVASSLLDPRHPIGLARLMPLVAKGMQARRASVDRGVAMMQLVKGDRLTHGQVGSLYGVGSATVGIAIARARNILALRARYPLDAIHLS